MEALKGCTLKPAFGAIVANAGCPGAVRESVSNHFHQLLQVTQIDDLAAKAISAIGTHSLCKIVVTVTRSSGCSKDGVNIRGHWESSAHQ